MTNSELNELILGHINDLDSEKSSVITGVDKYLKTLQELSSIVGPYYTPGSLKISESDEALTGVDIPELDKIVDDAKDKVEDASVIPDEIKYHGDTDDIDEAITERFPFISDEDQDKLKTILSAIDEIEYPMTEEDIEEIYDETNFVPDSIRAKSENAGEDDVDFVVTYLVTSLSLPPGDEGKDWGTQGPDAEYSDLDGYSGASDREWPEISVIKKLWERHDARMKALLGWQERDTTLGDISSRGVTLPDPMRESYADYLSAKEAAETGDMQPYLIVKDEEFVRSRFSEAVDVGNKYERLLLSHYANKIQRELDLAISVYNIGMELAKLKMYMVSSLLDRLGKTMDSVASSIKYALDEFSSNAKSLEEKIAGRVKIARGFVGAYKIATSGYALGVDHKISLQEYDIAETKKKVSVAIENLKNGVEAAIYNSKIYDQLNGIGLSASEAGAGVHLEIVRAIRNSIISIVQMDSGNKYSE